MAVLALLIIVHISFYVMVISFMLAGVLMSGRPRSGTLAKASVIVPAKDEEENIESCLLSLLNQTLHDDMIEILVVNDRSTDKTGEIALRLASNNERLRVVEVKEKNPHLTGKQNALRSGLEIAEGDVILNTDADCIISPEWARSMISHFHDDVGIVMGFTLIHSNSPSIWNSLLSLDMLFLLNGAAGAAGIGVPVSCIGNNIAYRPELIRELSSSSFTKRTIAEDAFLMQSVRRETDWRAEVAYDPGSVVETLPVKSLSDFLRQRARWMRGGFDTKGWTVLPLIPILILHLLIVSGFIASFFWNPLLWITTMAIGAKFVADLVLILPAAIRLRKVKLLPLMPAYEVFLMIYSTLVAVRIILSRRTIWKGDVY
jgi:cellulose synthase/poly-beta-1,6-N-acetylglucosamine synthase-like glycosyltransferase